MASKSLLNCDLFYFSVGILLASSLTLALEEKGNSPISRRDFPTDFVFGVGSSAYQYEGASNYDGRGPSIWDTFTKKHPEKIADRSDGGMAEDFYHRYKDDIKLMKMMNLDSFRFSISWPRILPHGRASGGINEFGIKFYNDLINELLANGIKPFVTLFHWDVPQALEDEYGGFLSPNIVKDFRDYANLVFEKFGDRVEYWATLNEPNIFTDYGYAEGIFAPGRCSNYIGNCTSGNSAIEPYMVGHNLLLCHAYTVQLYRQKYQSYQNGTIGITVATTMIIPINQTHESRLAASRAIDFSFGWYFDPVVYGDYPKTMRSILGSRLPKFTKEEYKLLKHSFDFLGLNYYTSHYAEASLHVGHVVNLSYTTDSQASLTSSRNGIPIGTPTVLSWLYVYPKGLQTLLQYMRTKYNNPVVYITEIGVADANNGSIADNSGALNDTLRVEYFSSHLTYLLKSIKEGANVRGMFAWTFFDDYEWNSGYTIRFGINFVDFKNGLKRYPKASFYWFQKFLHKN